MGSAPNLPLSSVHAVWVSARRAVRGARRRLERANHRNAGAPELGCHLPTWVGQSLRCPSLRRHGSDAPRTAGGRPCARAADELVCRRRQRLAAVRCREQSGPRLLPPGVPAFPWPAPRRRRELLLAGPGADALRELDRSAAGPPDHSWREREPGGCRADPLVAWPSVTIDSVTSDHSADLHLRRRLRRRPTASGLGRSTRLPPGPLACRALLLR